MKTASADPGIPSTLKRMEREMKARFERNLRFVGHLDPDVHQRFASYRPRRLRLELDPVHGPVLKTTPSGVAVYPDGPLDYAAKKVEAFLESPAVRVYRPARTEYMKVEEEAHGPRVNQVVEMLAADETGPAAPPRFEGFVNTLFVLGLGLGYDLDLLLERADVHHLCIVEPDPDVFFAALHTVDFPALVERFARPGYSLEFILERDAWTTCAQVASWFMQIGAANAVQPFVFKHRGGGEMDHMEALLHRVALPNCTSFLGYFDDERVGLAQTLENVAAGIPLLTRPRDSSGDTQAPADADQAENPEQPPVFVVANGPSLDDHMTFLREHRERAVVISCGTALGSLVSGGIVPDIHVETERVRVSSDWIQAATTPEQRAEITFIALNTIHPEVFGLFPRRAMANRPHDLGAAWIDSHLPEGEASLYIRSPGPTVGNCGVSVAAALGFRDIVTFGLDLAYPSGAQHHSRYSLHYRMSDDDHSELGVHGADHPDNVPVPGNFGGEVLSSPMFVDAAERVGHLVRVTPGLRVRNASRGIRIPRTEPCTIADLEPGPPVDGKAVVKHAVDRHLADRPLQPATPAERRRILTAIAELASTLRSTLDREVASPEEGMLLLLLTHMQLLATGADPSRVEAALILRGSLAQFSLLMARALHRPGPRGEAVAGFAACREVFFDFLADVTRRTLTSDFWAVDDRHHDIEARVARA